MCPIFQISNVTGENLDLLKMFLNLLSPRTSYREEEPAEFQIDDTYSVPVSDFGWDWAGLVAGGYFLPHHQGGSVVGVDLLDWGLFLGRVWGQ
jgi:GTPase